MASAANEGLQTLIEDRGTCAICLEIAVDHRMLPCQHIFCQECLEPMVRDGSLECPTCRAVYSVQSGGVAGLPKSFLLMDMLERFCVECLERGRDIQCECCDRWLCGQCYRACKTSTHGKIDTLLLKTEKLIKHASQKIDKIKDEQNATQSRASALSKQIDNHAERLVGTIRSQQKKLQQELFVKTSSESKSLENVLEKTSREKDNLHLLHIKGTRAKSDDVTRHEVKKLTKEWRAALDRTTFDDPLPSQRMAFIPEECSPIGQLKTESVLETVGHVTYTTGNILAKNSAPTSYASGTLSVQIVGSRGSKPGQLRYPSDVAVSPVSGSIVVLDSENSRVQIFDQMGKHVSMFGSKGQAAGQFDFWSSSGVAVTQRDHVVVSDTWNHRVQVMTVSGKHVRCIGHRGTDPGTFDCPCGVACHDNHIYVCDRHNFRVQVFKECGDLVRIIETKGLKPFNAAVSPFTGDVYVAGHVHGRDTHELRVYSSPGHVKASLGSSSVSGVKLEKPRGLAVDGTGGMLLVVDAAARVVHVMESNGQLVRTCEARGDNQLEWPSGVARTRDGRLVVADQDSHRLLIYSFS